MGRPPNPRVQRTRAYASLRRSPLTRHPLGALWAASLLVVLVVPVSAAAAQGWNDETVVEVRTRLNEPRLDTPTTLSEVYRAIWVPTFSQPTSVRLERQGDKWIVVTARLSGQGGYGLGEMKSRKIRKVTEGEVATLRQLVAGMGLFQVPSREEEALCLDGTIYSYEIVSEGVYRSWIRYCPKVPPFDRYLEFGRAMLRLAKLKTDDVE